jgi:hypothetical protein
MKDRKRSRGRACVSAWRKLGREMANNLLVLGMLWGVGFLLTNSGPAHAADTVPEIKSNATGGSGAIEMRRAPVPLVREIMTTPRPPVPTAEPASPPPTAAAEPTGGTGREEPPVRDAPLADGAARAAVEADGYKRVTVLGPGRNGTWRVKAYRGNTEVVVTVDSTGSVTLE